MRLLVLGDPRVPGARKLEIAQEFFAKNTCCLDKFSKSLRQKVRDAKELVYVQWFRVLNTWVFVVAERKRRLIGPS